MQATERTIPAPLVYPEQEPFWAAAREGRLMLGHCRACSRPHWYPRSICPLCGSDDTGLQPSGGRGTVYSVSHTLRAGPVPYAVAYVTLDEGVTMLTNIVDTDLAAVKIGDRVEVVFKPTEKPELLVPMFRPAS